MPWIPRIILTAKNPSRDDDARSAGGLPPRRNRPPRAGLLLSVVVGLAVAVGCEDRAGPAGVTVRIDAAASIAHVIEGLADRIERDLDVRIAVNAAASGTLAQQISRGDRADLFISADALWMDRLSGRGLIDRATRTDLAGNRLVLVGLTDMRRRPQKLSELSERGYQPVAVGDPAYVPAGRYALQALERHGLEPGGNPRLAEAPDARAVLAFVLSGQCPVGLVYASDAAAEGGVVVLLAIDPADHDPIRYPAAVVHDAPNPGQALRVLEWLRGDKAQAALRTAGFVPG
jgi:molybdate transport system substrate-binding protein